MKRMKICINPSHTTSWIIEEYRNFILKCTIRERNMLRLHANEIMHKRIAKQYQIQSKNTLSTVKGYSKRRIIGTIKILSRTSIWIVVERCSEGKRKTWWKVNIQNMAGDRIRLFSMRVWEGNSQSTNISLLSPTHFPL